MKVSFSQMPPEVLQHLKAWQQGDIQHRYIFLDSNNRVKQAVWAIVVGLLGLLGLPWLTTVLPQLSLWQWAMCCVPFAWSLAWGARYAVLFLLAPVKPCFCLTPMHAIRVDIDGVQWVHLWKDAEGIRSKHHYKDGIYNGSRVWFQTSEGTTVLRLSHPSAENLETLLQRYGNSVCRWLEQDNQEMLELFEPWGNVSVPAAKSSMRWLRLFPVSTFLLVGLVAGLGGFFLAQQNARVVHQKQVQSCNKLVCFLKLLEGNPPPSKVNAIVDKMVAHYHQNKNNVPLLRKMMKLTDIPKLSGVQKKKVLALYHKQSRKEIVRLAAAAQTKYLKTSSGVNPKAKQAIMTLFHSLKAGGSHVLKVSFESQSKGLWGNRRRFHTAQKMEITVEPFHESLGRAENTVRELMLLSNLREAFSAIFPDGLLTLGRSPALYRGDPLSMHIHYTIEVLPNAYFEGGTPTRYYASFRFLWKVSMWKEGKQLFSFRTTSRPSSLLMTLPSLLPNYRYRTDKQDRAHRRSVYQRMASSAFESFRDSLALHFGLVLPRKKHPF